MPEFDLAPQKKSTVVETQITTAMATVDENNLATNSKLDGLDGTPSAE
jgi:hypothetical protein